MKKCVQLHESWQANQRAVKKKKTLFKFLRSHCNQEPTQRPLKIKSYKLIIHKLPHQGSSKNIGKNVNISRKFDTGNVKTLLKLYKNIGDLI